MGCGKGRQRHFLKDVSNIVTRTKGNKMASDKESIRLSLSVSPELNERLEQLASSGHTTKTEILRKAIALYDVVAEAKTEKKRLGILDQNKQLLTEIVGI
jgi:predicted transcriptional regulator